MKTRRNWKWKIPHILLERWISCFSLYKNHKLKVKMCWVGARERKTSAFFVTFILSSGNFFKHFCFISMNSVLNKVSEYKYFYIFTYQKTLLHTHLLFALKIFESLQCVLNSVSYVCIHIYIHKFIIYIYIYIYKYIYNIYIYIYIKFMIK